VRFRTVQRDQQMFQLRSPSTAIIEAKISMFLSEQGPAMIERFPAYLGEQGGTSGQIGSVSVDMSPPFIKCVDEHLPDERMSFDKYHVYSRVRRRHLPLPETSGNGGRGGSSAEARC